VNERPLLIALDIDGTILRQDESLDPRVTRAITAVASLSGVHLVISTGRSAHSLLPVANRLGLDTGWAVASNGAVTVRLDPQQPGGYEITDLVTFDPAPVLTLLHASMPEAMFAVEDAGFGFRISASFPAGELTEPHVVVPFEDLVSRPVARVVMRNPESTPEEFLELTGRIGIHGVSFAVGWTAWLDLAPEGVSKATALETVRQRLAVAPSDTVAVGDGRNDLEMLRWAGRSIAMGQSPKEVLAAADETCGTVDEAGLADVLQDIIARRA
jgi:hydroxymethylpyrimidine pyrophosphatase-like HAD family hydrolase